MTPPPPAAQPCASAPASHFLNFTSSQVHFAHHGLRHRQQVGWRCVRKGRHIRRTGACVSMMMLKFGFDFWNSDHYERLPPPRQQGRVRSRHYFFTAAIGLRVTLVQVQLQRARVGHHDDGQPHSAGSAPSLSLRPGVAHIRQPMRGNTIGSIEQLLRAYRFQGDVCC